MQKFIYAVLGLTAGYIMGAGVGGALISIFSSNTHDKSTEVAMTAAFVTGPLGAIIGLVTAIWWAATVRK